MIRTSPQRPVGQPAGRPSAARPKASAQPRARARASRVSAVLLGLLAACAAGPKPAPPVPSAPLFRPEAGARITGSIEVAPGDWLLPAGEGEAALVVEGLEGAVLDLGGASLRGAGLGQDLDELQGVGLLLRGCRDVVVRNGSLGGWRACIAVEASSGVVLEDLSFDGWYGMRLRSSVAAEDGADWLWPHENDAGEWQQRYGAAISMTDCVAPVVRRCRGRHGQNGLLLSSVEGGQVYDNDFSFLSGWGLGMWRAVGNTVSRNVFDYCVRGYSHGVYWRGQDSAGILMFESCTDNVVAFNSATHGGDGVFLYAGHDLTRGRARDRGEEAMGSDRNLFWGNDLRFAVANALEATFSEDLVVVQNRLSGSHQHGLWGGYCSRMVVAGNEIHDTLGGGISIEHGQECVIAENELHRNEMGVELWWDEDPDLVGGPLGEQRDTSSRDHWIGRNLFEGNDRDLVVRRTTGLVLADNEVAEGGAEVQLDGVEDADGGSVGQETLRARLQSPLGRLLSGVVQGSTLRSWDGGEPDLLTRALAAGAPAVPGTLEFRAEERGEAAGGLETIVMGEWGPWDFRSGEPRPEPVRPGGLLADTPFACTWFRWGEDTDPRGDLAAWRRLAEQPLVRAEVVALADPHGGDAAVREQVGGSRFGLVARARVRTAAGTHRLSVTSDDGVRVLVDGEVVLEDWTWHAPRREEVALELAAGEHEVLVEYFQIDGALALLVALERDGE
jgi:hypothetical protein